MAANPSIQLGTDGNWAIKEDNLLAYKKDGTRFFNKEFNFSRGSLATFVDKDGLIKVSGVTSTELVINGGFDTDSDWLKFNNATISNGVAILSNTSGSVVQQGLTTEVGKKYKIKIDIQGIGNDYYLCVGSGVGTGLTNRNILHSQSLSAIFTATGTLSYVGVRNNSNLNTYTINNISVVEVQTDVPRIDFKDNTTGHLLLEPQSTNLITYSEDFSLLDERNNAVVTNNVTVSPSGLLNADEITFDGTSDGRVQASFSSTNGQSYTMSVYLKNKDLSDVTQVWIGFSASGQGQFVTITDEWQRYDVTSVANGTIEYPRVQFTGTGSLYAWGFQVEQLQYATSYIPTSGSTVTRNAEVCNNSGSVQDFNSEEGVLYAEIAALANSSEYREISLNDGNTINAVEIRYTLTANNLQFVVRDNGAATVAPTITLSNALEFNKIAFSYKKNDSKMYVNGIEVAIDTNCTMPNGLNRLSFNWGTIHPFYGKVKNIKVFKRALSDTELQKLTT